MVFRFDGSYISGLPERVIMMLPSQRQDLETQRNRVLPRRASTIARSLENPLNLSCFKLTMSMNRHKVLIEFQS